MVSSPRAMHGELGKDWSKKLGQEPLLARQYSCAGLASPRRDERKASNFHNLTGFP